jgi:hypothetical protein
VRPSTDAGGGAPAARRAAVKRVHGFDSWPGRERPAHAGKFQPALDRLSGLVHVERTALPGMRHAFIDQLEGGEGTQVAVRVIQYASAADAHEGLVDVLERSMAPRLPSCAERGIELGDVCFCGYADPIDVVMFVRGNVLVRVESVGTRPASVVEAASELDRQLAARP